ncbi:uncharacterized protein HLK63_I04983 [Nakaseomyces glabratus]|nr:hypothetical protein LTX96_0003659 [Nakaseomyces glabratus]UCS21456.1 uncharacterized protein GW608_I04983 [Nakaseomyces glabratus]UCS26687.1 uncharacterized protein HLK63_I04983 [Nakaseomyces glabratus]UCS31917.1 uncharacterized protein HLK64_I04983 [Nakaseomyces glabratus]UCS37145.1 uncharacterized protein HLK62_I04983 [Nakaseomyces glabratus]
MDALFGLNVEDAVARSLRERKTLVVYNKPQDGNEDWVSWLAEHSDEYPRLMEKGVWLKLTSGSDQFHQFEQIFPNVIVPSLYLIRDGKIVLIIQKQDDNPSLSHWKKLLIGLGLPLEQHSNEDRGLKKKDPQNIDGKTEKDKILEKSNQIQRKEYEKQLRAAEEERLRILKLVRADKAERLARSQHGNATEEKELPLEVKDNIKDRQKFHTDTCVLMFRLTDSKTITHTFDSKNTLNAVRKWVDSNRTDGSVPYSFHRNIPRVTFQDSDELKTLDELDLAPRSVLVLKALSSTTTHLNVSEEQGPGLISKMFTGLSSWWGNSDSTTPLEHSRIPENSFNDASASQINASMVRENTHAEADTNSKLASPIIAPSVSRLKKEPSEMNLTSRSVSPNIFKFVNNDDNEDDQQEKDTYNGNNVKLEKNRDQSD